MSMLFDAKGDPIPITAETQDDEIRELPGENLPPPTPKPKWFDDAVNKIGGFVGQASRIPKYRVVWGMDESNMHWAVDKMRMKYPAYVDTIQTTKAIRICKHGRKERVIPVKDAIDRYYDQATDSWTRNVEPGSVIVPVIETREVEIGTPLWIVEQFVKPEGFGTPEEWENNRYLTNPENAKQYIDILGEYPKKGRYIHWFDLVDYDNEGRQQYRELDEGAVEIIRAQHVSNIARVKRAMYYDKERAIAARDDRWNQQWETHRSEIKREMLDIKKHKTTFG